MVGVGGGLCNGGIERLPGRRPVEVDVEGVEEARRSTHRRGSLLVNQARYAGNAPLSQEVNRCRPAPRERAKVGLTLAAVDEMTSASSTIPRMAEADRIAEFKEVAELMPDDPVVRFGLAGAYLDAGKPENAADEYREAIRLKPDYSAAHRGLGRALERAGQIAEARVAYQQGLEVATRTGDLQTGKEIEVFLRRLEKAAG